MVAANTDLTIEQGATFTHQFVWNDSNGVPIDITGYTARMQIRQTVGSVGFEVELTTENGGITLGGALGTVDLLISATATAALDFLAAVYDLELVSPTSIVTRLVKGSVVLDKEVTR